MKKSSALVLIFISFSLTAMLFNNCSDNSFSNSASDLASRQTAEGTDTGDANETSDPSADGIVERDLTQQEIDDLINNIPPENLNDPISVEELLNDPTLYEVYRCDGNNIAICHFPTNVEAQQSKCVGRNAVTSHFGHYREYEDDYGNPYEISDYLGPCRIPLYPSN